jgi:two-component system cell cycle sensor histidine kinase/response regulator CckA
MSGLALHDLRDAAPDQHRLWVLVGIAITIVGYGSAVVGHLLDGGVASAVANTELWVLGFTLACLGLERLGRVSLAGALVFGVVWLEVMTAFATSPSGVRMSAGPAIPLIVLGGGLLFGFRVAWLVSCISAAAIPAALLLGKHWLGTGPGLQRDSLAYFVSLEVVIFGTAALLFLYMRTFAAVIDKARRNATRAEELVDDSPDAIVAVTPDARVEAFNTEAERLFALNRDEVQGAPLDRLPLTLPSGERLQLTDLLTDGVVEVQLVERERTLEVLSRWRMREDGSHGMLLVLRDVTQRNAAQARTRELEAALQHKQKLEAVGRLAGGIAHDFNNLLTAVAGYASLMADTDDPMVQEMCDQLLSTQQRGTALTRQLLAFARKDVARPEHLRLDHLLEGLTKLLERIVGERIVLDLDPTEVESILADPGQIEQVTINLAANARDAMPNGGTLYIGCRPGDTDGTAALVVRDTGIGMDAATRARIFEPFYTTKPRGSGTGLGLSTVHGIVSQSGGTIAVESRLGHGTTFTVTWPTCPAEAPRSLVIPATAERRQRQGTILVVEDDASIRDFVRRRLRKSGFQVRVAQNGAEAVALLTSTTEAAPDLILTDVVMPGLTGPQLAERAQRLVPGTPILYMSGYLDEALDDPPFDPVEDLLLKPFTTDDLLARVDAKLERRRWRKPSQREMPAVQLDSVHGE